MAMGEFECSVCSGRTVLHQYITEEVNSGYGDTKQIGPAGETLAHSRVK